MRHVSAIVARTREPVRLDLLLAVMLTVVGELEVLFGPASDGSRLVSALALAVATLGLAWRRSRPLLSLAAVAVVLPSQAVLDGFLVAQPLTPLLAAAVALYCAGRYVDGASGFARAVIAAAALVATRIALDPSVQVPGDVVVTLIAVALPLLVGRWVRGQALLQRQFAEKAQRLTRERERDTRHAAEQERERIFTDLQAAVADGLSAIVSHARALPQHLAAEDHAAARGLLASIAGTAREALADVRRVLGVLRRDGEAPRLAPPVSGPSAIRGRTADTGSPDPAWPAGSRTAAGAASAARVRRWRLPLIGLGASWLDRALVAALLVGAEIELVMVAPSDDRLVGAVTAVAIVAPLLWRRRRPVSVAVALLAAVAVQSTVLRLDALPACDIAALILASFAIGAYAPRRPAVAGLVLAASGSALHAAVFYPAAVPAALLGGVAVPWIVGRTLRGRRQLTDEVRQNAARVEHAAARDAQAGVMAERMRVARELHDVVAHNISVIAVQAAGAEAIVARDPERAAQCGVLIEAVAGEAMTELGGLIGALGTHMEDSTGPQSSLGRVESLARRARDSGLPVDLRIEGQPSALPAGVDLAAFRIVQEALTNTSKHAGDAHAWVTVRYTERAIEVEIHDDGTTPAGGGGTPDGCGQGLIGMRERVALYGGTLETGHRSNGGFHVRAWLPIGRP